MENDDILDHLDIKNVEIWKTTNNPKYWTAITFESNEIDFPTLLSKALIDYKWYVDFKYNNIKYIVLKDNVLTYEIGDEASKNNVIKKCLELGLPLKQLDWSE